MITKITDAELFAAVKPYTMVDEPRLRTLAGLVRRVDANKIPGDIVECGVCNGGSAAVLAHSAETVRRLWLLDSFEGMPGTTAEDGAEAARCVGQTRGSEANVYRILGEVGTVCDVHILKGWFCETLYQVAAKQIALLNIDCDWYTSVKIVLDAFYDRVVIGGVISIDDYGHWPGCRMAVDEFMAGHGLPLSLLRQVDYSARWFVKEDCKRR